MTAEEKINDIRMFPENHGHNFVDLQKCCMIDGAIDCSIMEAHSKYVNLGVNGGKRCDVTEGPCACGAWH